MAGDSHRPAARAADDYDEPRRGGSPLMPLATFLLGAVLGGGIIWFATGGVSGESPLAGEPEETPVPTQTVTASPDGVVIPGSCLRAAEEAQQVTDVAAEGLTAARDLDAIALSRVVREFASAQDRVAQMAEDCRQAAEAPGATTAPAPEPTTDEEPAEPVPAETTG
ncbi:MAG: hypothetical protein Q4F67_17115 [Propionibacteriaceae bacterium]|nr:hypothetical protein [Propionibacteriaceae bacterium]